MIDEPGPAVVRAPAASAAVEAAADADAATTWRGRLRAAWNAFVAGIGILVGLLSHLLHHVSVLAGTALVAGSGGTALFGVVGLLASAPFLWRLHRRFERWRAPAIGLLVFIAMFALSAFVIGPAISGVGGDKPPTAPSVDHNSHH